MQAHEAHELDARAASFRRSPHGLQAAAARAFACGLARRSTDEVRKPVGTTEETFLAASVSVSASAAEGVALTRGGFGASPWGLVAAVRSGGLRPACQVPNGAEFARG
ncbi:MULTISPECIES: hypothetical protein [unclassified Streptomyces]|uniref:hypothetical protein n=1 Tax=unclassified Streptomyces TaxID=2593676 RepID=UPI003316A0AA